MSTSANYVNLSSSWKQEVNRRVAAHMNRKAPLAAESEPAQETRPIAGSRAAQAAARVAARYAKAPSYSEMLANEARAAVQAAEAASRAALEAQAVAQSVLDSLEAAACAEAVQDRLHRAASIRIFPGEAAEDRGLAEAEFDPNDRRDGRTIEQPALPAPEPPEPATSSPVYQAEGQPFAIRWEPDMPVRRQEPVVARARRGEDLFDLAVPDWPEPDLTAAEAEGFEIVEPAQPIHANLIEFPREVVATRKMRPRRAEGPLAAFSSADQLSIFEVDPETVSTQPSTAISDGPAAPDWMRTKWANIELDEPARKHPSAQEELAPKTAQPAGAALVSLNRRLLALVVDGSLTLAAFVGFAALAVASGKAPMGVRTMEFVAAFALLAIAAGYQTLFFTLGNTTPGLWYAGVCLRTLRGERPTREQRRARLIALPLSVLPLGLGLIWALFDETHLTWHDRLSGTYLRKR